MTGDQVFVGGMAGATLDVQRLEAERDKLLATLAEIRTKLESIVCTEGTDAGVVLLSQDAPTHTEIVQGQPMQVYDHEYFSPLGDALIELYLLAGGK